MKSIKTSLLTLLAVVGLALSGCAGAAPESTSAPGDEATVEEVTRDECDGVWAVADFGELGTENTEVCVTATGPITAIEAFESAGFELQGVSTSDQFFACRINGLPEGTLEHEGDTYEVDCADFGPVWAWWGLFIDTGNGWEFAMEGAELQEVAPGEAVAFAWQFGDTSESRLPAAS